MTDFATLLQQGTASAWLFVPSAIFLGALHGLEPGHSKTMMAAFIVAVRGTIGQAILLGLCAALSHTAVVWVIAMGGMYLGQNWSAETSEPYLQMASALIIMTIGVWMIWRTWQQQRTCFHEHGHHHADHDHDHDHDYDYVDERGHDYVDEASREPTDALAYAARTASSSTSSCSRSSTSPRYSSGRVRNRVRATMRWACTPSRRR